MTWPQAALALLLTSTLAVFWHRYSMATGGLRRLGELYLWLLPPSLAMFSAIHDFAGLRGFVAASVVHLAIVTLALWKVYPAAGASSHARLAGILLILGAVVVWLGASTFPGMELEGVAAHRNDHLFTVGGFLVGSLVSLAGFIVLRAHLRERGDALFSQLGLVALVVATVGWIFHLAFRATVMIAVAEKLADARPEWYQPLRLWAGAMYVSYMVLASLSLAAYGLAMAKTGRAGKGWGWGFVAFAVLVPVGNVPLAVQFVPYAMGMILLRRASVAPASSAAGAGQSS